MSAPTCQCGCGTPVTIAKTDDSRRGVAKGQPYRFVAGHRPGVAHLGSYAADADGCWIWQGSVDRDGYGRLGQAPAHRAVYEAQRGPIPDGLDLDHLCRVKACVNPDHLEPVTNAENARRRAAVRTHCKRGHEFTPENTYVAPRSPARICRTCNRDAAHRYAARKATA